MSIAFEATPRFVDLSHYLVSSRRRHTRCSRDWSSDVCSSDLMVEGMRPGGVVIDLAVDSGGNCELSQPDREVTHGGEIGRASVGKECRSWWLPCQKQKNEEAFSELLALSHRSETLSRCP